MRSGRAPGVTVHGVHVTAGIEHVLIACVAAAVVVAVFRGLVAPRLPRLHRGHLRRAGWSAFAAAAVAGVVVLWLDHTHRAQLAASYAHRPVLHDALYAWGGVTVVLMVVFYVAATWVIRRRSGLGGSRGGGRRGRGRAAFGPYPGVGQRLYGGDYEEWQ